MTPYPNGGEANWEDVDEVTPDEDSTYVKCTQWAWGLTDLYNLPASSGAGTINKVTVYARCRNDVTTTRTSLKIALKTGGTLYEGSEIQVTTSYVNYWQEWANNPATGSAWTWEQIDALQIGVTLRQGAGASTMRCTQAYVEVDYTAVAEKTSADTGSGVDAVTSLQTPVAKLSADAGSGLEGTPASSAALIGGETGSSLETIVARLLATFEVGGGVEASSIEIEGQLKNLLATELGEGTDSLAAKIEMPTKGGGMKLWT